MARLASGLRSLLIWLHLVRKPDFVTTPIPKHPAMDEMVPGRVYVVIEKKYRKWAYFLCPGETGEAVMLSLQQNRWPRWRIVTDILGRPTIHPSIRQLEGTYAHFWIRKGMVNWCPDSGIKPI